MTLGDAIKHANEVANANERLCETVHPAMQLSDYGKCAEEHRQLAKWLEELKRRREALVRLKEQISILRSKIKSLSKEYENGFMSALSATEAMIATLEQEENNE